MRAHSPQPAHPQASSSSLSPAGSSGDSPVPPDRQIMEVRKTVCTVGVVGPGSKGATQGVYRSVFLVGPTSR